MYVYVLLAYSAPTYRGRAASKTFEEMPSAKESEPLVLDSPSGLRRRKRRKIRGYMSSDDDCDDACCSESSADESAAPRTPQDEYFPPIPDEDSGYGGGCGDDDSTVFFARILPMQVDQASIVSVQASLSFAEACVDRFAPYHELREADEEGDCEKAEKVLGRLLTEWYVVGASVSRHPASRDRRYIIIIYARIHTYSHEHTYAIALGARGD